jgi:hypothetical protein
MLRSKTMSLKWTGDVAILHQAVSLAGRVGSWKDANPTVFTSSEGEILRFYPTTGTLQFQGKNPDGFERDIKIKLGLEKRTLDI